MSELMEKDLPIKKKLDVDLGPVAFGGDKSCHVFFKEILIVLQMFFPSPQAFPPTAHRQASQSHSHGGDEQRVAGHWGPVLASFWCCLRLCDSFFDYFFGDLFLFGV